MYAQGMLDRRRDPTGRPEGGQTKHIRRPATAVLLLVLLLAGCSGQSVYRNAQRAELTEDWDQAVLQYLEEHGASRC